MSRPKVTLENQERVYEWYRHNGQRPGFAKLGHKAVAWFHRPEVRAGTGTDRVIQSLLATETRLVLVANHTSAKDVTVLPAVAWAYEPLRPIVGNARIVSKQEMCNGEFIPQSVPSPLRKVGGSLMRVTGDALGMIPALRGSSNKQAPREQLVAAHQNLAATEGYFLDLGTHIAKFGEGSRNYDNPEEVQPTKAGVKYGIEAADPRTPLAVVTVGIWHTDEGGVSTHIGSPIMSPATHPDLLGEIQTRLQHDVDMARTTGAA